METKKSSGRTMIRRRSIDALVFVRQSHHARIWNDTAKVLFAEFGDGKAVWRCLFCAVTGYDDLEWPVSHWWNQLH